MDELSHSFTQVSEFLQLKVKNGSLTNFVLNGTFHDLFLSILNLRFDDPVFSERLQIGLEATQGSSNQLSVFGMQAPDRAPALTCDVADFQLCVVHHTLCALIRLLSEMIVSDEILLRKPKNAQCLLGSSFAYLIHLI